MKKKSEQKDCRLDYEFITDLIKEYTHRAMEETAGEFSDLAISMKESFVKDLKRVFTPYQNNIAYKDTYLAVTCELKELYWNDKNNGGVYHLSVGVVDYKTNNLVMPMYDTYEVIYPDNNPSMIAEVVKSIAADMVEVACGQYNHYVKFATDNPIVGE